MQYGALHELDEQAIARVAQTERLRVFNERSIIGAVGALAGIALVCWVLLGAAGWTAAMVWTVWMTAVELAIFLAGLRCRRALAGEGSPEFWKHLHFALAGLGGVTWGAAVWFVWRGNNLPSYLATMTILVGVAGVSMVTMASYARATLLFFGGLYLVPFVHTVLHASAVSIYLEVGLLVGFIVQLGYARELGKVVLRDVEQFARNQALVDKLHELLIHDQLTGAYSRRHMFEQMEQQVSIRQRHGASASVIMFDLDHFKAINDNYGHPVGDRALRAVTKAVAAQLRGGDLLGRVGGEEFLVLLPHTGMDAALPLAERLRQTLAATSVAEGGRAIFLPASFGVAELKSAESPAEWFRRVDGALYEAKERGRNQVFAAPA